MAYVVTDPCIRCKYTDCAAVWPISCFHEGPNFLVIDPDECIDCDICVPECPVDAIFPAGEVPAGQMAFIAVNAERAATSRLETQAWDGRWRHRGAVARRGPRRTA